MFVLFFMFFAFAFVAFTFQLKKTGHLIVEKKRANAYMTDIASCCVCDFLSIDETLNCKPKKYFNFNIKIKYATVNAVLTLLFSNKNILQKLDKKLERKKKNRVYHVNIAIRKKETSLKALSLDGCYDKNWVAASNKQSTLRPLQCLLCGQVANNAMELTCDEHDDYKDTVIVGEQCLIKYLKENNDQCPIGEHGTCKHTKGRTARNFVCELKVICPRQFMKHFNQREENEAKEGDTPMEDSCAFKGKINEVKEHLENTCSLKTLECIFKKFGCNESLYGSNFEEHMELQMKRHLDLLLGCISDRTVTLALEFFCLLILYFKKKTKNKCIA
ncbi:hypothetical protein RFI_02351 [Reticulomyxa filosa]|uniref:TRAF-type domain-containing protein n=1 Tax=Reticulomyxa filosa TaxID=46433 RepID=X6P9J4_RETFI|nr:hypothetical protein RFI_02351 [Reticulomyxa filosa]|eukprot:ETO34739.1 hypothetical protein RFI_02351 [Reticulomyxa filosa]